MSSTSKSITIPIIAFFGTKGGVGKTTITSRFAEFITYACDKPNVLMMDFDVQHRGLTILWAGGSGYSVKTIHDYMVQGNSELEDALDVTDKKALNSGGKLYLIPASQKDFNEVFKTTAALDYADVVNIMIELIKQSIYKYDISCVVIDCGPIIDTYTAAAAHIADRAFIIGQNEKISYESLSSYPNKIRDFYRDFNSSKMSIIINKVRAIERVPQDVFLAIPFTMEIVDLSEGIEDIDQIRLSLFDSYIQKIVENVFQNGHPELIPERGVALAKDLKNITPSINKLYVSKVANILKMSKMFCLVSFFLFLLLIALKALKVFFGTTSENSTYLNYTTLDKTMQINFWDTIPGFLIDVLLFLTLIGFVFSFLLMRKYAQYGRIMKEIEAGGDSHLVEMLVTRENRAELEKIRMWMKNMKR